MSVLGPARAADLAVPRSPQPRRDDRARCGDRRDSRSNLSKFFRTFSGLLGGPIPNMRSVEDETDLQRAASSLTRGFGGFHAAILRARRRVARRSRPDRSRSCDRRLLFLRSSSPMGSSFLEARLGRPLEGRPRLPTRFTSGLVFQPKALEGRLLSRIRRADCHPLDAPRLGRLLSRAENYSARRARVRTAAAG